MSKKKSQRNIRHIIIDDALLIESYLTICVGNLLRIGDFSKSMTLGFTNFALSSRAKIQILKDLKLFNSSSKMESDLIKIFEIRNKFAHLVEVDSFVKLSQIAKDLGDYLKNNCKEQTSEEILNIISVKGNKKNNNNKINQKGKKGNETKHLVFDEKYLFAAYQRLHSRIQFGLMEIFQKIQGGLLSEIHSFFLVKAVIDKPDEIAEFIKIELQNKKIKSITIEKLNHLLPKIIGPAIKAVALKINEEYRKSGNIDSIFSKEADLNEFLPYLESMSNHTPSTNSP